MKLSKIFLAFSFIFVSITTQAQVGIGTTTPAASAQLEVSSTSKGLLIPQIALTGSSDATTIASPASSLLVYNTATTSDVLPGYYYNSGTTSSPVWLRLNTGVSGVPYTGATSAVDLGSYDLTVNGLTVGKGAGNISDNTAIGFQALASNTTGYGNIANGYQALFSNIDGIANIASGFQALYANISGNFNTASGSQALYNNNTGNFNTASGYKALYANILGNFNTASGPYALYANTTGDHNIASGYEALNANTTGYHNIASGFRALYSNTTGGNNTAIGSTADVATNNLTNASAIGYGAIVAASNTIQLGNTDVTNVKTSGTVTAGTITYPNTAGSSGYYLMTDGSGTASWSGSIATISANVNAQTGTTYTLQNSDNGKVITLNNSSAITLTVPSGLSTGFNCLVVQLGAGAITFTPTGTTIYNRASQTKTAGQYAIATLVSYTTNTFITSGDMIQ